MAMKILCYPPLLLFYLKVEHLEKGNSLGQLSRELNEYPLQALDYHVLSRVQPRICWTFRFCSRPFHELGIAGIMLRVQIPAGFNYLFHFRFYSPLFSLFCVKLSIDVVTHLWQLFCDISSHEHSLEVNPQVLHCQPVLNNVRCV